MLKFLSKNLFDTKVANSIIALTMIYCCIFNSQIILYNVDQNSITSIHIITGLVKEFITSIIIVFIIFFALSMHRVLFIIGTIFLFLTGATASYLLYYTSHVPNIWEIDFQELKRYLGFRLLLWNSFSLVIAVYSLRYFKIENSKIFCHHIIGFLCLFFVLDNILEPRYDFIESYFPMQYLVWANDSVL